MARKPNPIDYCSQNSLAGDPLPLHEEDFALGLLDTRAVVLDADDLVGWFEADGHDFTLSF